MDRDEALAQRVLWQTIGYALIVAVVVVSLLPVAAHLPGDRENWSGHLLSYGLLMAWFSRLHRRRAARLGWAVGFALMGVAVEFLQRETGYRTFDPGDMLANSIGVALGWLASPPRAPSGLDAIDRWLASHRRAAR